MLNRLCKFSSRAEFDAARPSLPYPCVASFFEENDLYVFFRHSSGTVPDSLFTVGASRFVISHSVLGGAALLGAERHAEQTPIPVIV